MNLKKWMTPLLAAALIVGCSDEESTNNANAANSANSANSQNSQNSSNNTDPDAGNNTNDMGNEPVVAEFGLDARPANTTCVAPDRPPQSVSSLTTERAFPNLSFSQPVWMQQAPGDDSRWFVIEQAGRVRVFDNDDATMGAGTFIDITGRVDSGGEKGLLGMAFHPDWPTTKKLYLSYTAQDGGLRSIVSSFTVNDAMDAADPGSEVRLLSTPQPFSNHNGGQISFGPDDYLYISLGDGGSANDPQGNGQNTDTLLGSILRIDVDGALPYGIPSDNPFAEGGGAPEIYAWGLRNVWRFSFDRATGKLYAGDVGQNQWEEVDIIERGGNYGWSAKEGFHCFDVTPCDEGPWIDPIWEYDHSNNNRSITGGYVYNGTAIPELVGTYLFADYVSGRIWGIFYDENGDADGRLLLETGRNVSSFAEDNQGELYHLDYGGGIFRFVPTQQGAPDNFPRTLSATGCVDANDPTKIAGGLVPYEPNAPFWSDGATKLRWVALPEGQTVDVAEDGDLDFPIGTVLVKSFEIEGKLVETRLMVRHEDGGWGGYTYEWRDDQSDADLLVAGKTRELSNGQTWIYPSRAECMTCHTEAAGRSLGLELGQLNGESYYASTNRISNQLSTWNHIGLFSTELTEPVETYDAFVDPFGEASLDDRARAYLHTNCASCHRSDAALRVKFDMRWHTDLADKGICNENPIGGRLGVPGARLLNPGSPDESMIYMRMTRRDAQSMPPLGSAIVDDPGAALIREWIENVTCP